MCFPLLLNVYCRNGYIFPPSFKAVYIERRFQLLPKKQRTLFFEKKEVLRKLMNGV